MLVTQTLPMVTASFKIGDKTWQDTDADGLEASIHLKSIDCTIELKKIYRGIKFADTIK